MDFHSLFPFIFWKHCKPKVLQHHPSLQNADLFFVKQRLKLKCLQSGNHPKFEHLPGTISTHKKYQSFFQLTFQDIDFFFFLQHHCYFNKRGKMGLYRRGNPRGGKLHKPSFEIKICPFRINEESDKTREQIYRGTHQPSPHGRPLSWQPAAGEAVPAHKSGARCRNYPQLTLHGRSDSMLIGVPSGPKIHESIDALRLKKQQLLLCST